MKSTELIEQLDKETFIIVRSDNMVMRDDLGLIQVESIHNVCGDRKVKELNSKALRHKLNLTFRLVLLADYKRENPNFVYN